MTEEGAIFYFKKGEANHIKYDSTNMLPIFHAFDNVIDSSKSLALTGWLTDENNHNLSYMRKWLLRYHQIIGHLSFQHLQWIGLQDFLGAIGLKI